VELAEVVEVDEGDGDDEIEYMPPPVVGELDLALFLSFHNGSEMPILMMRSLTPERPYEPPYEQVDLAHAFGILSKVPPLWTPFEVAEMDIPEFVPLEEPEVRVRLCGKS
jgi:hypothetical protein